VGKLKAAVAARTDPTTVIVARTSALAECPGDEALQRIRAYAATGAEALMIVGMPRGRADLEAVHQATTLPLCVLNPPAEIRNDRPFLAANGVRILMLGNPIFAIAVKAIYDSLKHLHDGGALEDLQDRQASQDLLRAVHRLEEFLQQQHDYMP
jgi:carboxyvinyl-carboxyphosphonate phosphorylmutase